MHARAPPGGRGSVMLQDEARARIAWPVDDRNPHWTRYRDIAEQVVARAKEPFEIEDIATPCTMQTIGMATRYAIRLALREGGVPDAERRKVIAEGAYTATAQAFWSDDAGQGARAASGGARTALDDALRYATFHTLNASGIERRWQEAAAYQEAWERTETKASVP